MWTSTARLLVPPAPLQPEAQAPPKDVAQTLLAVDRSGKDGYEDTITASAMKDPVPWPWVGGALLAQPMPPNQPDGNPWPYYNGVSPNGRQTPTGTYVPWYPSDFIGGIPSLKYPELFPLYPKLSLGPQVVS